MWKGLYLNSTYKFLLSCLKAADNPKQVHILANSLLAAIIGLYHFFIIPVPRTLFLNRPRPKLLNTIRPLY